MGFYMYSRCVTNVMLSITLISLLINGSLVMGLRKRRDAPINLETPAKRLK